MAGLMFIIDHLIRGVCVVLVLLFLGLNFSSLKTVQRQEELLLVHLHRLSDERTTYERLSISGAKILKRYAGLESRYLNASGRLRPEYLLPNDSTLNTIELLDQLHQHELILSDMYNSIFGHNDCWANPPILAKSLLDNRVHVGKYLTPNVSAKYDVFINNTNFEYTRQELYRLECSDTLDLQINILRINYKTYEIDTTIVKEQLIVSDL